MFRRLTQISVGLFTVTIMAVGLNAQADNLSSQWVRETANYEVPAPAELARLANFEIADLYSRTRNGRLEMKYTLPLELTGARIEIRVKADRGNPNLLKGAIGRMECTGDDCAVRYLNADIYDSKVAKFLVAKGFSGTELNDRLKVAQLFKGGDPAGIVHFRRSNVK